MLERGQKRTVGWFFGRGGSIFFVSFPAAGTELGSFRSDEAVEEGIEIFDIGQRRIGQGVGKSLRCGFRGIFVERRDAVAEPVARRGRSVRSENESAEGILHAQQFGIVRAIRGRAGKERNLGIIDIAVEVGATRFDEAHVRCTSVGVVDAYLHLRQYGRHKSAEIVREAETRMI